jgi:hypothetical protein
MGQIVEGECNMSARADVSIEAKLLIGWQEVDRLVQKEEYAAALLVAAVGVEFVLSEDLWDFYVANKDKIAIADDGIRCNLGDIKNRYLGTGLRVARYLANNHNFSLKGRWEKQVQDIKEQRDKIAHERNYFEKCTKLQMPKLDKERIERILDGAHRFCIDNAP